MALNLNINLSQAMKQNEKLEKKYKHAKHKAHKLKKLLNEQHHVMSGGTVNSINDMTILS